MTDEIFEIAFSGQIVEGADLQSVKQHIGMIFKADAARLQHLFSGRRVLIKREADQATVIKYQAAFKKAGAICEVRSLNQGEDTTQTVAPGQDPATKDDQPYQSKYPESDLVPQALLSTPLGGADKIQPLDADMAPVGSPMQDQIKETPEPSYDLTGLEVAPVGSILSDGNQKEPPPPPDTSGLSMAD